MDFLTPKNTKNQKLGYVVKRGDCYHFVSQDGTRSDCMRTRKQAESFGEGQTNSSQSGGGQTNSSGTISIPATTTGASPSPGFGG